MKNNLFLLAILTFLNVTAQRPDFTNRSLAYPQLISEYEKLDSTYKNAQLFTYGKTDCGEPLKLFVISSNKIFSAKMLHEQGKCILFINNGIHPGEPDGMDASLRFAKDLLQNSENEKLLEHVVICIVPTFNIDGALNRNNSSRVNQFGPEEYGFRGNAKNLDLNRDFVKTDAKNTASLKAILQAWDPDVFVDTHVSDGADYVYTMTLISSQHNKSNPIIGGYMHDTFTPALFKGMKEIGDEMSPYVSTLNEESIPDSGIAAFLETPRFASGYMSLYNCFSFITEAHMLKSFARRASSTHHFLQTILNFSSMNSTEILATRKKAFEYDNTTKNYFYNWELNMQESENLQFNGYEATYPISAVTGLRRLKYAHEKPFAKNIKYYNTYSPTDSIEIPEYFYIPIGYENIIKLLSENGVNYTVVKSDSLVSSKNFYIDEFKTGNEPYEGHYLHSNVKIHSAIEKITLKKGDFLISTKQKNLRILLETLIPNAQDSYFCWGFFDSILQEKEWFSSYVFEDIAADLLQKNDSLKNKFSDWKKLNPTADSFSQLYFIYKNSPYFEKSYRRYPVGFIYR